MKATYCSFRFAGGYKLFFGSMLLLASVFLLPAEVQAKPELRAFISEVSPSSPLQGNSVYVRFNVRNWGNVTATAHVRVYLSSDDKITTSDTYLGGQKSFVLKGKQSRPNFFRVKIPLGAKVGKQYIGLITDYENQVAETDETNNTDAKPITVKYNAKKSDLSLQHLDVSPTSSSQGGRLAVRYRLYNAGALDATAKIRFYLSKDKTITTSDTYLNVEKTHTIASKKHAPSASQFYTATLYLPANFNTRGAYVGAIIDYDNQVAELSESNNTRATTIRISPKGTRDLQVNLLSVSPITAKPGDKITVRYRAYNQGTLSSGNATLRLYYSTNGSIESTDAYLGHQRTINLGAGRSSSTYTVSVSLPGNATSGIRYIGAVIDYNKRVSESNETNNTRAAAITVVPASSQPDLQVNDIFIGLNPVKSGQQITIRYRVYNAGPIHAVSSAIRFYLSKNSTIDTTDTYLNVEKTHTLNAHTYLPSSTTGYTTTVKIPSNLATGTYHIGAIIDYNKKIAESNESNNTRSIPFRLESPNDPDLQVNLLSLSSSSVFQSGTVRVTYRIQNMGSTAANQAKVRLYLSNDKDISTNDTYLGVERLVTLASNQSSTTFVDTIAIPSNFSTGTRYIGVFADFDGKIPETDESNNKRAIAITIQSTKPDLQVDLLNLRSKTVQQGTRLTITYRLYNAGRTVATSRTRLYFSKDKSITISDTYLNHERTVTLKAGQRAQYTTTVTLPLDAPLGIRFIGAIIDYNSSVSESNETNNTRLASLTVIASRNKADLTVHALFATSRVASQGKQIILYYRLYNGGRVSASAKVRFYLSADRVITTGDTYLGVEHTRTVNAHSFAPSATKNYSAKVILPLNAPTGLRYIGAIVDYDHKVAELSETNNTRMMSIQIGGLPSRDLLVDYLRVSPASARANDRIAVTYRVDNQGSLSSGNATLRLYYSIDSTITTRDTYLNYQKTFNLNVGAHSYLQRAVVQIPSRARIGTGYIGAIIDYDNKVREHHENNNTRSARIAVLSASSKPDLQVTYVSAEPSNPIQGGRITLFYRLSNAGKVGANNVSVRFYYSTDSKMTTSDTYLGAERTFSMAASSSMSGNYWVYVNVPANATVGKGYVGALVDYHNKISESNETNNSKAALITVLKTTSRDVQVDLLTVQSTTVQQGGTAKVTYRILNSGTTSMNNVKVRLYFSLNDRIATDDTYLNVERTVSLQAGKSATYSDTVTIPSGANLGTAYLGAIVNSDKSAYESDYNNNSRGVKVTVQAAASKPDLQVEGLTLGSSTVKRTEQLSLKYKIRNTGKSTASNFVLRLYYSKDKSIDLQSDTYIKHERTISSLAGGTTTTTYSATIVMPLSATLGTGYIGAVVDYDNKIAESNESNNVSAQAVTVLDKSTKPIGEQPPTEQVSEQPITDAGPIDAGPTEGSHQDCYTKGCPSGQICREGRCISDPCKNANCRAGEFCRAGRCFQACGCKKCAAGEKCVDGACQNDPCANTNCRSGEVCDANGKCVKDLCANITCGPKRTCKEGKCVDAPCENIKCPSGSQCKAGQCVGNRCTEAPPEENNQEPSETQVEQTTEASIEQSQESPTEPGSEDASEPEDENPAEKAIEVSAGKEKTSVKDGGSSIPETKSSEDGAGEVPDGESGELQEPTGGCCSIQTQNHPANFLLILLLLLVPALIRRRRKE